MKLLVLGGGISPEREVSQRSAKAVAEAAKKAGFHITQVDPASDMEILDKAKNTIVLPILHGKNGEDGVIQTELENRNLPFLGTGSAASFECFDKWATRLKLTDVGMPMPAAELVDKTSYLNSKLSKKPHVLKILHGGSSIGTLIIRNGENASEPQVNEIFAMENKAVLEQLVEGTEITVPVLDKKALPVIEIVPPLNGEFDYANKYNGKTQEIVPAKTVSPKLQRKAQELAEKTHQIMGCRHLSRVDMMIDPKGNISILEVNTMPGMTDGSLFPKSAAVAGMDMPQLVKKFVDMVKRDYNL